MKKTKFWVLLFSALFILSCGAFFLFKNVGGTGTIATVRLDGERIDTIDLDAVAVPYDFTVEYGGGYNVVHVEHGSIAVTETDCPDQVCVRQGDISGPGIPIVCMPHRLVIEIEGEP